MKKKEFFLDEKHDFPMRLEMPPEEIKIINFMVINGTCLHHIHLNFSSEADE